MLTGFVRSGLRACVVKVALSFRLESIAANSGPGSECWWMSARAVRLNLSSAAASGA